MTRGSLLAMLALSLGVLQAAEKVVGGPVVVNMRGRRATITWVVETSDAKLGKAPANLDKSGPVLRFQKVTFTGLEAGTTYYYDVLGRPEGQGRFKTPPAPKASFQFVVYGDTRTRHDVHRRVVEAVIKAAPDFLLQTGDLVEDGDDPALWPVFFSIEKELLNKAALYPVLGNHERGSRLYYDAFDQRVPYYSFDWGSAHFTQINTDIANVSPSQAAREAFWNEQLRWLEADLWAAQKADLRFAMMHHPMITAAGSRQNKNIRKGVSGLSRELGETDAVSQLISVFEKYKVHAVFSGHDHNYQRHVMNGVQYIVTGGGGAPLYPVDAPIPGVTQKVESVENFVTVKVEGGKAVLEAVRPDGSLIERVQVP